VSVLEMLARAFASAWRETGRAEMLAAALAVAYLLLAIRQSILCWLAAFVSSCLYAWVVAGARLYMEAALNAFYAAMAIYGFLQWRARVSRPALAVQRWPLARHGLAALAIVVLALPCALLLRRFTAAASPFLDAMITWSSVFATWLVARKVYENWHWWLVIDSVSLGLYLTRRLYLTALLFAIYLALIVVGMRAWRRELSTPAHAT
jgi:nicotinamide mononucleotide transporter